MNFTGDGNGFLDMADMPPRRTRPRPSAAVGEGRTGTAALPE